VLVANSVLKPLLSTAKLIVTLHISILLMRPVCIGSAKAADSYLRIDRVISAAEIGNVQAIHPGYGFLSENAHFAEVCRSCDIEFIGPTPEAMERLGDKNSARTLAREADVPTVPGSPGLLSGEQEAIKVAKEIGFPVLLKATAGGGGKGMRVAANDLALSTAWQQASAEAEAAFGNAGIYIEKYVEKPRHVEIQVLGDQHGTMLHLWERDCSTQRRHQKLIEESPSPRLPEETRAAMTAAAVRLAKASGYYSAGTVEFIVDQENNFYFIEVNARIQVEHPVSEMVTGIDLLKQQIRVAAGEKLTLQQEDIVPRGHAIECRINAEDPAANFRPCPGKIEQIIAPGGFGVRFDSHVAAGYVVPPYYDSLIGKLIVHQPTREGAIETMTRALRELQIKGIATTVPLHLDLLSHSAFHEATIDTKFVERLLAD
jgi:acetyl-CoA carboxylase biotin carboxylase subunit